MASNSFVGDIMDHKQSLHRKRVIAAISVGIVLVLSVLISIAAADWLRSFSDTSFRDYIQSFGVLSWAVLLVIQFLQVFIALIPGELVETAAGFAFGPLWGTVICYLGVALASAVIFLLTRKFGIQLVELFVSREKINKLRFLNTERKRNLLIFLLFFIPGTPKDLLTYFVGLTDIRLGSFLVISLIARFPSVISSTAGGHLLGEGNYVGAIWLYAITGAVSLAGLAIYNFYLKRKQSQ